MLLSLNEVEATVLKASRGAGMEWGLAEEAANAARWLARQRLGFEAAFLSVLEAAPWRAGIVLEHGTIRPREAGAWLCPIHVGACLSDLGDTLPLRIERVLQPLWLLPFAARLESPVLLACGGVSLLLRGGKLAAPPSGEPAALGERAGLVELTASVPLDAMACADAPPSGGIAIDAEIWPKLQAFEARTYVPASLRSRLSGAGAGASDND